MKFTLDNPNAEFVFGHYGDGKLKVNQTDYESSLIIFPDALHTDWPVNSIDELSTHHLQQVIERKPDIMLLGTGIKQRFPSADLRRELITAGLNLEIMDTRCQGQSFHCCLQSAGLRRARCRRGCHHLLGKAQ